jgi:hypothetical protein
MCRSLLLINGKLAVDTGEPTGALAGEALTGRWR